MQTIKCIECGRTFQQGEDTGRPYGECPGCGHVNSAIDIAFKVRHGEELVAVMDCRGEKGLDLYAVPSGDTSGISPSLNTQVAINCRRVGYWSQDGDYGEWIFVDGEPSGITEKECARYIGEAH